MKVSSLVKSVIVFATTLLFASFFSQLLFVGKFSFIAAAAAAVDAVVIAAVDIDHSLTPNSTTFKMSFLSIVVVFPIRILFTNSCFINTTN